MEMVEEARRSKGIRVSRRGLLHYAAGVVPLVLLSSKCRGLKGAGKTSLLESEVSETGPAAVAPTPSIETIDTEWIGGY